MRRISEVSVVIEAVRDFCFLNNELILLQLWRHSYTASYHIYDFNARLVNFAQDVILIVFAMKWHFTDLFYLYLVSLFPEPS